MSVGAGTDALGRILDGKYRLEELLHADGGVRLYRAEHIGIQRMVEVKTLEPTEAADPLAVERINYEARAVGGVTHRNVQSVVDSGATSSGIPFIVYEALVGATLEQLLEDEPLGFERDHATKLVLQLADAVREMHEGGVVHRALSPKTIMILPIRGGGELLKITGFDHALMRTAPSEALPLRVDDGSPYFAPELLRGAFASEPTVDVYAVGVLLRAILTGRADEGEGGTLSPFAARVVERATAVDPAHRFASGAALFDAAGPLVGDETAVADDDASAYEDALHGDVDFVAARSDRRVYKPAAANDTAEYLSALLLLEAVFRRVGQAGWEQLVARVPDVELLHPQSGDADRWALRGVPTALVTSMLEAAAVLAFDGEIARLADLGEAMAPRVIEKCVPHAADATTTAAIVEAMADVWPRFLRDGQVSVQWSADGAAYVEATSGSEPSVALTAVVAGVFRGMLRTVRPDASLRLWWASAAGDPTTAFVVPA